MRTLLWFKRDLRLADHEALAEAVAGTSWMLPIHVVEPSLWGADDASAPFLAATARALRELRQELAARDRAVARWCLVRGVAWSQPAQDGVVRALADRDAWTSLRERRLRAPQVAAPAVLPPSPELDLAALEAPPAALRTFLATAPEPENATRHEALARLDDFLRGAGSAYRRSLSSPLSAAEGCSRLSTALALGTVSVREVVQAVRSRKAGLRDPVGEAAPRGMAAALSAFEARLHWRCHFIQKLESQPSMETENLVRSFDGLREDSFDEELFGRWAEGRTGYPMVDACMRQLSATGWINFRMRAMLVSVASFPLWLHWRRPGSHLARRFVDYEPGIHWPQVQMQAGTTGINTLRVYNPVKQARDHDPRGDYVRRWVPELAGVPDSFLFEPSKMPLSLQDRAGCRLGRDYPTPPVDVVRAGLAARDRLLARRATPAAREEAREVLLRHGSRKGGGSNRPRPRRPGSDDPQLVLL